MGGQRPSCYVVGVYASASGRANTERLLAFLTEWFMNDHGPITHYSLLIPK